MEYLQSLLLGLIQGLTEFLPVSSSGHLVLMRGLFGIEMTDPLAFDVAVHVATLLAVVVYFRREVWKLFRGLWWIVLSVVRKHRFEPNDPRTSEARLCLYVALASLPRDRWDLTKLLLGLVTTVVLLIALRLVGKF